MEKTKQKWANSKYTVNCPEKIRQRILKNLHAAAQGRSPQRAQRAKELLNLLNKPSAIVHTPPAKIAKNVNTVVGHSKRTEKIRQLLNAPTKIVRGFKKLRPLFNRRSKKPVLVN